MGTSAAEYDRMTTPETPVATPAEIKITKALNGYIVKVGCQTVVFESRGKMLSEIDRYYANPEAVEKEYRAKA